MNILDELWAREKGVALMTYFGYDATFQVAFIFMPGWQDLKKEKKKASYCI